MAKARGSIVIVALEFETRWGNWILWTYLILPAELAGICSASNRNECEKLIKTVSGEQRAAGAWVWPHHHLWADCIDNVRSSASQSTISLRGLLTGQLYLLYSLHGTTTSRSNIYCHKCFRSQQHTCSYVRFWRLPRRILKYYTPLFTAQFRYHSKNFFSACVGC
jgi:hypothetical protein